MNGAPEKYLLACDVDNTLVPTDGNLLGDGWRKIGLVALETLRHVALTDPNIVGFGSVTGRTMESQMERADQVLEFADTVDAMGFSVTSVGTVVHHRTESGLVVDTSWPVQTEGWQAAGVLEAMQNFPGVTLQDAAAQGEYKVSYDVARGHDFTHDTFTASIRRHLAGFGVRAEVIFSGGQFLDLLPRGINKGAALRHVAESYMREIGQRPTTIAAGDSMNDTSLLDAADIAIVPANADASLHHWASQEIPHKTYFATKPFAAGIVQGLSQRGII